MALIPAVLAPMRAQADSLDDILQNPVLTGADKANDLEGRAGPADKRWFVGRGNLNKLFSQGEEDKGPLYLLDWLGEIANSEYRLSSKQSVIERSHVALLMVYSTPGGPTVNFDILVPHPLHRQQVELGLLSDFAKIEPPGLAAASFEQLIIHTHAGTLYEHKDGSCSLLFKFPDSARVNLRVDHCEYAKYLTDIAEQSDLNRLAYKLEN